MRIIFFFFLVSGMFICSAQKITINEIDKFTKNRVIATNSIKIKNVLVGGISFSLVKNGPSLSIVASGFGTYSINIGPNDAMMILLDNDSTVTVNSIDAQFTKESDASVYKGYYVQGQKNFRHIYAIAEKQIEILSSVKVKAIRRYHNEGAMDLDIKGGNKDDLMNLAEIFLKAIKSER